MILSYGTSVAGPAHVEHGVACQDANGAIQLKNNWVAVAVADGVGSCKHADIAAALAVQISLQNIAMGILAKPDMDFTSLPALIGNSFSAAELEIEYQSRDDGEPIWQYDTTLSLAVYDGSRLAYGHSGDGGIVGLTPGGDYIRITSQQRKEGRYVVPLRAGRNSWLIGVAEGLNFASVLLATDGIYDALFPQLLHGRTPEIYVPLARYLMDNRRLKASENTILSIQRAITKYLASPACNSVRDDKTVAVLINGDVVPACKEESYYAEPDWNRLQQEWERFAAMQPKERR